MKKDDSYKNGSDPKVTIIIPCRDSEDTIGRCLDSIINQTYTNLEILCIDDRSKDDTVKKIESYSKNDERIMILKNEKWLGTMRSRIKGIESTSGEYICFIDSDDYVESNYVEALLRVIRKDCADIAFTRSKMMNGDDVCELEIPFVGTLSSNEYRSMFASSRGSVIQWYVVWGKMYTSALMKSIIPMIKPYEKTQMCEDLIINGCLPTNVECVTSTADTTYNYCIDLDKGMTSSTTSFGNMKQYLKDTFCAVDFIRDALTMDQNHHNEWKMYFNDVWKKRIEKTPKNMLFKIILHRDLKKHTLNSIRG